jgi:hypothetical protein
MDRLQRRSANSTNLQLGPSRPKPQVLILSGATRLFFRAAIWRAGSCSRRISLLFWFHPQACWFYLRLTRPRIHDNPIIAHATTA